MRSEAATSETQSAGVAPGDMKKVPDGELIELSRRKETRAFEELVNRYHLRIFNYCYRMLTCREDAEDVTQEVFLRLARNLPKPSGDSLAPWLYRVATTVCIDEARRRNRRVTTVTDETALLVKPDESPEGQPEEALEGAALQRQIAAVLATLPGRYRAALVLRELQGLRYEEIAVAMKIPRRQVDTIVFRARREFKARFSALSELSCAAASVKISAMVDGELPADELPLVRAHLRACADCRELERQFRKDSSLVRALIPVLPSAGLKAAILVKGGLALGAAVGVGGGLLAGKIMSSVTGKATMLALAALLAAGVVGGGVVTKMKLDQAHLQLQTTSKSVLPHQAVKEASDDAENEIAEGLEASEAESKEDRTEDGGDVTGHNEDGREDAETADGHEGDSSDREEIDRPGGDHESGGTSEGGETHESDPPQVKEDPPPAPEGSGEQVTPPAAPEEAPHLDETPPPPPAD